MPELTQAEQDFFATGELPAELQAEADAAAAAIPIEPALAPENTIFPDPIIPAEQAPAIDTRQFDALQANLQAAQERAIRAEERLAEAQRQQQAPKETVAPDENDDPIGAMMHQIKQVNATVAELQNKLTQEQQNSAMKEQFNNFVTQVRQIRDDFSKSTPDFDAAYAHVRNVRAEDLRNFGVPDANIQKALLQDELSIAQSALQRGKNPAEEIYNMAKRYGFKSGVPVPSVVPPIQNAAAKISTLQKGTTAAHQPQRAANDTDLTLAGLKEAGDNDLNKVVQDDKLWARIIGGTSNDIF